MTHCAVQNRKRLSLQYCSENNVIDSSRGHCVVFLGKTPTVTLTRPLSTQEYKYTVGTDDV